MPCIRLYLKGNGIIMTIWNPDIANRSVTSFSIIKANLASVRTGLMPDTASVPIKATMATAIPRQTNGRRIWTGHIQITICNGISRLNARFRATRKSKPLSNHRPRYTSLPKGFREPHFRINLTLFSFQDRTSRPSDGGDTVAFVSNTLTSHPNCPLLHAGSRFDSFSLAIIKGFTGRDLAEVFLD